MDERQTRTDQDAEGGERHDEQPAALPPVAMAGAMAPVAGLAAVVTAGFDPALADDERGADDDSEEARGARIEADPPTDPSAPQR